jgi:DNA-binding MarR family transcriptional regulator
MDHRETSTPTAAAVADQFGRTAKRLARAFDEALAGHGVTTPRARVLMHVAGHGPTRLNRVAAEVGVAQGTASELAEALVRDGLLDRRPDPTDRRATLLQVSEQGAVEAEGWRERYGTAAEDLFAALSGTERRLLVGLLRQIDGDD